MKIKNPLWKNNFFLKGFKRYICNFDFFVWIRLESILFEK
jgi:hypothetical protein